MRLTELEERKKELSIERNQPKAKRRFLKKKMGTIKFQLPTILMKIISVQLFLIKYGLTLKIIHGTLKTPYLRRFSLSKK